MVLQIALQSKLPCIPTYLSTFDSPTTPEARAEMQNIPYINAVGALMYLAVSTRPDIAYILHSC